MTGNKTAHVVTEPLRPLNGSPVDLQALKTTIDKALQPITSRIDRTLFALGDKFPK